MNTPLGASLDIIEDGEVYLVNVLDISYIRLTPNHPGFDSLPIEIIITGPMASDGSLQNFPAYQCTLYPCLRQYSAEINKGSLRQTLLDTTPVASTWRSGHERMRSVPGPCFFSLDWTYLSPEQRIGVNREGYRVNGTSPWIAYNCSTRNDKPFLVPEECLYSYGMEALDGFEMFVEDFFGSWLETSNYTENSLQGSSQLQVLYHNGYHNLTTINRSMEAVANALSARMQSNGGSSNSEPARGVMYRSTTCIGTSWGWFALPMALALLTILFFALVIRDTAWHGRRANWKTSPLALLFHGLEGGAHRAGGTADGWKEMQREANMITVRLVDTAAGQRLFEDESAAGSEKPNNGSALSRLWQNMSLRLGAGARSR